MFRDENARAEWGRGERESYMRLSRRLHWESHREAAKSAGPV